MASPEAVELVFDRVTKFYGGVIGVNDVTLRLGPGITGLLGSNGAGKSTLLKLASGRLRPSLGTVQIGHHPARSIAAKRLIGYCPDVDKFYEEMTGREFVVCMTRLYGYSHAESRRRAEEALARVDMTDRAGRRLAGYSHGMRQRIKLAQALAHEPRVLLLDEPLNGIDPGGRREINDLVTKLAGEGMTILVSSHLLSEVERLADRFVVVARGRLIAHGTLTELRRMLDDVPLTIRVVTAESRRLAALCVERPEVTQVEVAGEAVTVRTSKPPEFFAALNDLAAAENIDVAALETLDAGAEAVFDYLQRGAT